MPCQSGNYGGANHGNREHGGEGHVCGGGVRESDHANGGGEKEEEPACSFGAVDAPSEPSQGHGSEQGRNGAGKTRGGFTHAEKLKAKSRAPVVKYRLFEPWFAIEAWSDPVAGFDHGTSNPRVAGFVRPDQAHDTKIVEIADVKRCNDEKEPSKAGCGGISGRGGVVSLRHGKMSLALREWKTINVVSGAG